MNPHLNINFSSDALLSSSWGAAHFVVVLIATLVTYALQPPKILKNSLTLSYRHRPAVIFLLALLFSIFFYTPLLNFSA